MPDILERYGTPRIRSSFTSDAPKTVPISTNAVKPSPAQKGASVPTHWMEIALINASSPSGLPDRSVLQFILPLVASKDGRIADEEDHNQNLEPAPTANSFLKFTCSRIFAFFSGPIEQQKAAVMTKEYLVVRFPRQRGVKINS